MKGIVSTIVGFVSALLVFVHTASAQQQPEARKKAPRLTTEDVLRDKPTQVIAEPAPEAKDSKAAERAGAAPPSEKEKEQTPAQVSPEETAWRESVKHAREKARAAQRAAEEAELRVNDLRNQLGVSGRTTAFRNQTAADLDEAGRIVRQRMLEARQASDEMNALLEEGSSKGYKEEVGGPKEVTPDGRPNEEYYRTRHAELASALEDAERREQLYENRVRELGQRITNNSKAGDNFFIAQIQQERDEAQRSLDQAIAAREKAAREIESLKDQARSAGVPPGIFR